MTDGGLRPAEAARRLGVPTKVIVQAMYERKLPRVRLADGTLGIPADALADFQRQCVSRKPPRDHLSRRLAGPLDGPQATGTDRSCHFVVARSWHGSVPLPSRTRIRAGKPALTCIFVRGR